MEEKYNTVYEDDRGNSFSVSSDSGLSIDGELEDPEYEGKIAYWYLFKKKAAELLEETLFSEFGNDRVFSDILAEEFDYSYGLGELHFYCEKRGIPHSYNWEPCKPEA